MIWRLAAKADPLPGPVMFVVRVNFDGLQLFCVVADNWMVHRLAHKFFRPLITSNLNPIDCLPISQPV